VFQLNSGLANRWVRKR